MPESTGDNDTVKVIKGHIRLIQQNLTTSVDCSLGTDQVVDIDLRQGDVLVDGILLRP